MRHGKSFNHLGRTASHRKAMLANMASSLIMEKRITTTLAKAKALRKYVEPLLTKAKNNTTHSRRVVFSYLKQKDVLKELFDNVADKIMNRSGGYTRIIKLGNRLGDNAEICMIELVDFNETLLTQQEEKSTTSTRRRRRRKKSSDNADTNVEAKTDESTTIEETPEEVKESEAEATPQVEEVNEDDNGGNEAEANTDAEETKSSDSEDDTSKKE